MAAVLIVAICLLSFAQAQTQNSGERDLLGAKQLYELGRFEEAEGKLRTITKKQPKNVQAQMILGQTLFREHKFAESIDPYLKVVTLEKSGMELSRTQQRILGDQLAMAYGLSGRLQDAKAILQRAVTDDPEYPMNYYNLACVFAEEGNKAEMLKNLSRAVQYKDYMLPDEHLPDPTDDRSFTKYAQDADFRELVKHMGK